jgi:hypothetical protein
MNRNEQLNLKDYLHLYLGCDVMVGDWAGTLQSVGCIDMGQDCVISMQNQDEESGFYGEWMEEEVEHHKIKPLLRPLSDMTDREKHEVGKLSFIGNVHHQAEAAKTVWLLSKGFDLFGLIEDGMAIDKTTYKP